MLKQAEELLAKIKASGSYDYEKILKAYNYAERLHEGQKRISGEDYIIHPLSVAEIVFDLQLDTDSICAAFLHDTVEDCAEKIDLPTIKKEFGSDVAEIVDGVTKLLHIPFETKQDESIENLRKMFLAMSKDLRVIFVKLADRLHNMRTLAVRSPEKQRSIALETMHVYAPLAHRLGMQKIKQELETLALYYLDPIGYNEVKADIEKRYGENKDFLDHATKKVEESLDAYHIKYSISGRVKTIYSIYRKMYNQSKKFDEIYDFYAVRIIVDTELDCYTALGVIHEQFNSIPGRFKDYISTPKPNMYRSLHTTVIGKEGIPFEVQIRTWEMHQIAEYGLAAHWKYKSGEQAKQDIDAKLQWIRTLLETEKDTDDPDEFFRPLKIDLFEDEIFVFTPKGDVVNLPNDATPIDFAYAIHSAVGNKMVGAKVDKRIVPLDYKVKNGEIVEVLTSSQPGKGPSRDWLKIVTTNEARTKIRTWFKRERRDENIAEGRQEYERELRRNNINPTEEQALQLVTIISEKQKQPSVDDFYAALGYGGIILSKIMPMIREEYNRIVSAAQKAAPKLKKAKTVSGEGVVVEGVDNCLVKLSRCCNPIPGDDIIGFITRGHGVSVHKRDCTNVPKDPAASPEPERWMRVYWNTNEKQEFYASLLLTCIAGDTLMNDIFTTLNSIHVAVTGINTRGTKDGRMLVNVTLRADSVEHLRSIMGKLSKTAGVTNVERSGADI